MCLNTSRAVTFTYTTSYKLSIKPVCMYVRALKSYQNDSLPKIWQFFLVVLGIFHHRLHVSVNINTTEIVYTTLIYALMILRAKPSNILTQLFLISKLIHTET